MSHFYGVLSAHQYKRTYRVLSRGSVDEVSATSLSYNEQTWTIHFCGQLTHYEAGLQLLNKYKKVIRNRSEYVVALYSIVSHKVASYISEDSFLLLDNGEEVFIYNRAPLYCAREKEGDICIGSEPSMCAQDGGDSVSKTSPLLYFNNNLKSL